MSAAKELLINQLKTGLYFFEKFTGDLTDGEYFRSPAEGANHPAWIVGHVACSEDAILAQITGTPKRIPAATNELFKGGSPCRPDPSVYPSRKQIDELFLNSRARTFEELARFDESRWNEPSPSGWQTFPTLGAMWGLQGTHQFWHLGQLTVCRQTLRKPRVLE